MINFQYRKKGYFVKVGKWATLKENFNAFLECFRIQNVHFIRITSKPTQFDKYNKNKFKMQLLHKNYISFCR